MVGPPPVASSMACAATKRNAPVRISIVSAPASAPSVLLQAVDRSRPDLLHQSVDDLDAGEIALVHRAVEGLTGEGFAVQRAVRIAIEEATDFILELAHAFDRGAHQRPGQLLMRQPFAALDGVHEMALDRVARVERHVVAALHHARAAAFSEQAFGRDGDAKIGIGLVRVQRREQAGAAGAENQNVGLEAFEGHGLLATILILRRFLSPSELCPYTKPWWC